MEEIKEYLLSLAEKNNEIKQVSDLIINALSNDDFNVNQIDNWLDKQLKEIENSIKLENE